MESDFGIGGVVDYEGAFSVRLEKDIQKIKELIEQGKKFKFKDSESNEFQSWKIKGGEIVIRYSEITGDLNRVNQERGELDTVNKG